LFFFLPVSHGEDRVRRWPYVTFVIIALNVIIFSFTILPMERNQKAIYELETELRDLKCKAFLKVEGERHGIRKPNSKKPYLDPLEYRDYRYLRTVHGDEVDAFWKNFTKGLNTSGAYTEYVRYKAIQEELDQREHKSILKRFGYTPAEVNPIKAITAAFLHAGFMHLLGNMFFLYLVGAILEDALGIIRYLILYIISAMACALLSSLVAPGMTQQAIGASGAVSGLMGAFMLRFARVKINVIYFIWFFVYVRMGRAKVTAWLFFGLWFALDLINAIASRGSVTYVGHVGGFVTGLGAMFVLSHLGSGGRTLREEETAVEELVGGAKRRLLQVDKSAAAAEAINVEHDEDFRLDGALPIERLVAIETHLSHDEVAEAEQIAHQLAPKLLNSGQMHLLAELARLFQNRPGNSAISDLGYQRLAQHHFSLDDPVSAKQALHEMTHRYPRSPLIPKALWQGAQNTLRAGDEPSARLYLQELLARHADHPLAIDARQALDRAERTGELTL